MTDRWIDELLQILPEVLNDAENNFHRVDGEWGSGRATPENDEEFDLLRRAQTLTAQILEKREPSP